MAVRGKPWAKGVSGNPKGRPKAIDLPMTGRQMMQAARRAGPRCIEVLIDVMENGRPSEKLNAVAQLLDRGYGKALASPDILAIRELVKRNLESILTGHPRATEMLADLKRRLDDLEDLDGHRMIEGPPPAGEAGP